jgi:hypothetical protein
MNRTPQLAGNDWYFRDDHFPRWQLDAPDGMMEAIVERPQITLPGDHPIHLPLGWTWRNSWAGPGRWTFTKWRAMQAARDESIRLSAEEYQLQNTEYDDEADYEW